MRIKAAKNTLKRKKKLFDVAKGAFGKRSKSWRQVKQHAEKALDFAYTGRKDRKGDFRSLWVARINAACRANGTTYSRFMAGLKKAKIGLNRKMLSEIAIRDGASFSKIVSLAKGG